MRKNGIDRQLRKISGGICAPEGYKANAVVCGIRKEGGLDFGMIFSEKRCAVACMYASGNTVGAPVKVSKKNMRNGYARAILVNGGVANVFLPEGEKIALSICDLFLPYGLERGETVIASTGRIGERLELSSFKAGVKPLWEGLSGAEEQGELFAQAISSEEAPAKQLSFAFDLGDYPCKIGVIFKGGQRTSPNMATFLAFLTTDVNISTPMLQKALTSEVNETLNLLSLDGTPSPNDTICIMANGRAGNYKIDCMDAEYKKFKIALRLALTEICIAAAKAGDRKVLRCKVKGAQSKQLSRSLAKGIISSYGVKKGIEKGALDIRDILYTIISMVNGIKMERLRVALRSSKEKRVLYEQERAIPAAEEGLRALLSEEDVEISVDLGDGNFQSVAFGCI